MPSPYVNNYGVVEITASGATSLTANAHAGVTVVSNLAAAQTWTLPASSGSGNRYRIAVHTTKTGDMVIQVANATDILVGALEVNTDASGTPFIAGASDDTITMNGSTTGGVRGSYVDLVDYKSGFWAVSGRLISTGTEATPFSAAVS